MAIGGTALQNTGGMNSQLQDLAVRAYVLAADIAAYQEMVVGLGQAGLCQIGFAGDPAITDETDPAAGDAGRFRYSCDVLNTWAAIFSGNAIQPDKFNFGGATAEARGPRVR